MNSDKDHWKKVPEEHPSMGPHSTFAIVVGVEEYALGKEANLPGPAHDALRFTQWLIESQVPAENIRVCVSPLQKLQFPVGVSVSAARRDHFTKLLRTI